jgi:hypothetical protein
MADNLSIKEDDLVPGRDRPVDPETGWKPILHCFPERRAMTQGCPGVYSRRYPHQTVVKCPNCKVRRPALLPGKTFHRAGATAENRPNYPDPDGDAGSNGLASDGLTISNLLSRIILKFKQGAPCLAYS